MDARRDGANTTELVSTLLGLGAKPSVIPSDMWKRYLETPLAKCANWSEVHNDGHWAKADKRYRQLLSKTLNLSQRYFLEKASRLADPSGRKLQVARAHQMSKLLEVPYHIIGQEHATQKVFDDITYHVSLQLGKPLVLLFSGPSGHGKTELAKQMGAYLSLQHLEVDCTQLRHETDLFGPKAPYTGSENGSPLNNHLCMHSGKPSIVFLDEFEKSTQEVWRSLLLVTESGQ